MRLDRVRRDAGLAMLEVKECDAPSARTAAEPERYG
jgi:hypothetical protein